MTQDKLKKKLQRKANDLWEHACNMVWGDYCDVCRGLATNFHHYIPRSRNGLLRYEIKNGVPVCRSCHYKIHFSHNPAEQHRIIETIRKKRGKKWCNWVDKAEKIHSASFNKISWLESEIKKLEGYE